MIEVPAEFLNVVFALLIVFASVNRAINDLCDQAHSRWAPRGQDLTPCAALSTQSGPFKGA